MNLYSAKEMTLLLERHDFFFKKNLGQNFLMNRDIAHRIAATARETLSGEKPKLALEIGPGAGSLTLQLAELFDRVIALEIDPHLIGVLEESLAEVKNTTVIQTDALAFDFDALAKETTQYEIAVCSNLPYYITSEVIMRLLESSLPIASITVLIQKEACNRLAAMPGSADWGAITASVSYYAKREKCFSVGPGNFIPRPKVDSAVLRLIPHKEKPVKPLNPDLFFRVIRAAFSARRKTLSNALSGSFGTEFSKEELLQALTDSNILPSRRGETLNLEEFSCLSDHLEKVRSTK